MRNSVGMVKNNTNRFKELIKKYLEGDLSDSEERVMDGFLENEVDKVQWDQSKLGDKDQVYQQLWSRIDKKVHRKRRSVDRRVYAVAASIALLIGIFTFTKNPTKTNVRFTTTTSIDSLLLSDGSKVVLSPNSILEFPEEFDDMSREVKLIKGNAFFDISRDSLRPFRIDQDNLMTEVLGTSFNIRVTPLITEVDVKTGVVAVSNTVNKRVVVHKNEKAVFHRLDNKLEGVKESNFVKWYAQDVSLTNITLREFSKFLENRYGYKLAMQDKKLLNERIIIHITGQDTIQGVLEQLHYITDLNFKIIANEIEVYKN